MDDGEALQSPTSDEETALIFLKRWFCVEGS